MATPAEPRLARLAVLVVFVLAALARAQNRLQEDRPRRSLVDWYFFDASDSGAAVGNVGAAPLVEARRTERHFAQQGGSGSNWAASRSVPAGTGTSSQYAEYEGLTRCFSLAHGAEGVCVDASMPGACTQPLAYKATPWSQVPVCPAGLECCPMFATGPAEGDRADLGASPSWDPYTFSYYPPPDCHRNHPHHHTQQPQQPPMPVQQAEWSSPQAPMSSVPPRFGLAPTRQMAAQQPRPQAAPMPETLPMSPLQPPQDSLVPLIGEDAPGSSLQSTRKPGDLARQKCVEYEKWAPTVRFGPDKDCVPNHSYPIGGNPAVPNEFPHMAHLGVGRKNSIQWFCGGSLIAPTWVLTAAHCLYSQDRQVQWVRLGDQEPDTDKEEYNPQIIAVKQVVRHPEYRVLQAYNDIGLLRLAREPDLTPPYVRPACLQVDKQLKKDKLNLIGFGLTEENGDPAPVLMEVAIYRTPYEKCRKFFDGDVNLRMLPRGLDDNSQLCAGLDQVGKDACQGDSGGPLNTPYSPTCMLYVAGITSFGQGCGRGAPGVYTRVSHFVPWIESIVWPGE